MEKDSFINDNESTDSEMLYEHYAFTADSGQAPLRVDKFLMSRIEKVTRNKIQQAAKAGSIFVADHAVKSNYKVKGEDEVKVLFAHPPYEHLLVSEQLDLDLVYEDDALVVINKPAGMVVHPGHGNYSGTLLNGLIHHFEQLPTNSNNRPGLVHRIDKDTSGLLVVAKTEEAMTHLAKQFFDKTSERKYIALVWGDFEEEEGTVDLYIGRSLKNRKLMVGYPDEDHGKHAITHYKVIERFGYVTLIECRLETGRTHQIRAHMKHIGHPLFNDLEYGGDSVIKGTSFTKYKQFVENCFQLLPGQALHAKSLGFIHPKSGEDLVFDSELPDYFEEVLEKWRRYTGSKN